MCRYAFHSYKAHFACFACRKAFKKTPLEDYVEHKGLWPAFEAINKLGKTGPMAEEAEKRVGITRQEINECYLADVSTCPQCGGQMAAMGLDFKAPLQRNAEAWRIVATLYENGFAFGGCGCGGPGYVPPAKLKDLPAWLEQHQRKSEGARLLDAIRAKSS